MIDQAEWHVGITDNPQIGGENINTEISFLEIHRLIKSTIKNPTDKKVMALKRMRDHFSWNGAYDVLELLNRTISENTDLEYGGIQKVQKFKYVQRNKNYGSSK